MSSLVNLAISFIMGLSFGHQIEEPKTAHQELQKQSIEIYQQLKARQKVLNC